MHESEIERLALDQIEPQLVRQGYRLVRNPSRDQLPSFLDGYIPDAIALGKEPQIAFEIKGQEGSYAERSLSRIRKMFEGHDDWKFQAYYFTSLEPLIVSLPTEALEQRAKEISDLAEVHAQAAFVLAWSVLEATVREVGLLGARPNVGGPNRMISLLASEGYVPREAMSELLELANLRNKIVHGQLDADPSAANVERILDLSRSVRNADDENPPA